MVLYVFKQNFAFYSQVLVHASESSSLNLLKHKFLGRSQKIGIKVRLPLQNKLTLPALGRVKQVEKLAQEAIVGPMLRRLFQVTVLELASLQHLHALWISKGERSLQFQRVVAHFPALLILKRASATGRFGCRLLWFFSLGWGVNGGRGVDSLQFGGLILENSEQVEHFEVLAEGPRILLV